MTRVSGFIERVSVGLLASLMVLNRGREPFARLVSITDGSSSAIKAVKHWKYEPARHKGQPITVYRIIQIPFKLNV